MLFFLFSSFSFSSVFFSGRRCYCCRPCPPFLTFLWRFFIRAYCRRTRVKNVPELCIPSFESKATVGGRSNARRLRNRRRVLRIRDPLLPWARYCHRPPGNDRSVAHKRTEYGRTKIWDTTCLPAIFFSFLRLLIARRRRNALCRKL